MGGLRYDELGIGTTAFDGGRYTLRVFMIGKPVWEGDVELVAGRVTHVEVDVVSGRASVDLTAPKALDPAPVGGEDVLPGQLHFDDDGLDTILADVASRAGLALEITPAAATSMEGAKVTFTVEDLELRTVLALLLGPQELAWRIERGTLHVGTAAERGD